ACPGATPFIARVRREALRSFLARPSNFMVSLLSIAILMNLRWSNESSLEKMGAACLFRDIALVEDHLCLYRYMTPSVLGILNIEELEQVRSHPLRALEILRENKIQVYNVDEIILEHHESPFGEGFPRKLKAANTTPMSCVLIL